MGGISNYAGAALLNHFFNANAMPNAASLYVALHSGIPNSDTGYAPEVLTTTWTNYKRPGVARSIVGFPLITNGRIGGNASVIGNATSGALNSFLSTGAGCVLSGTSAITLTGWSLLDAATGGNQWCWTTFSSLGGSTTRVLNNGGAFSIDAGKLQITFNAGGLTDFEARNYMNVMLNNMGFSRPSYWIAPLTDLASVTEVSTSVFTNYKRLKIDRNATNFPVTSTKAISNGIALGVGAGGTDNSWFTSGSAAVTTSSIAIKGLAIFDAATGGNACWVIPQGGSGEFILNNGSTLTQAVGSLVMQLQ